MTIFSPSIIRKRSYLEDILNKLYFESYYIKLFILYVISFLYISINFIEMKIIFI